MGPPDQQLHVAPEGDRVVLTSQGPDGTVWWIRRLSEDEAKELHADLSEALRLRQQWWRLWV